MFTQVFVETGSRRPWPMAVSALLQCLLIALLVLLPLLFTRAVSPAVPHILIGAPTGPGRSADPEPARQAVQRSAQRIRSEFTDGRLITPVRIPRTAEIITDLGAGEPSADGRPGIIGTVPGAGAGHGLDILNFLPRPGTPPPPQPATPPPPRIQKPLVVSSGVQEAKLISRPMPLYPPLARAARISGVVRLVAFIGEAGTIEELRVVEGHAMLVQAALEAVRQWHYRPTILNGHPVRVETTIDVVFTLAY
jgi:protein TonB